MQIWKTLKLSKPAGWWKDTWEGIGLSRRHLSLSSIHLLCGMFQSVSHCDKWIFKLQLGTNQTSEHWRTSQFSVSVRSLTSGTEAESSVSFSRKLPQEKTHNYSPATTPLEGKVTEMVLCDSDCWWGEMHDSVSSQRSVNPPAAGWGDCVCTYLTLLQTVWVHETCWISQEQTPSAPS